VSRGDRQNVPSYASCGEPGDIVCFGPQRFTGRCIGATADAGADQCDPAILPRRLPELLCKCPYWWLGGARVSQGEHGKSFSGVPTRRKRCRQPRRVDARPRCAGFAGAPAGHTCSGCSRPNHAAAARSGFAAPRLRFRLPGLLQFGTTRGRSHHRMPARKRPVVIGPVPFRVNFRSARQVAKVTRILLSCAREIGAAS
jgi:hypothetical protein